MLCNATQVPVWSINCVAEAHNKLIGKGTFPLLPELRLEICICQVVMTKVPSGVVMVAGWFWKVNRKNFLFGIALKSTPLVCLARQMK